MLRVLRGRPAEPWYSEGRLYWRCMTATQGWWTIRHTYLINDFIWVTVSEQYSSTSVCLSPSQMSDAGSNWNPFGHWQVKLPGVFRHRPLSQRSRFITHSSMSENDTYTEQTSPHFVCFYQSCVFRVLVFIPHRCSFCPTGRPRSLGCRSICKIWACSHTLHSDRCQDPRHTR